MQKRPIIFDCDPGADDAVALLAAMKAETLDIKAITTVSGNVSLEKTTQNALDIVTCAAKQIPVYAGAAKPLVNPQFYAENVHGENGLDGYCLEKSTLKSEQKKAWEIIKEFVIADPEAFEIIATGPLTNIAIAFTLYPEIISKIKRLIIMGGSATYGNTTPAAEFNIFCDPEAADIVFKSGVPIDLCSLDVTHKAVMTESDIKKIRDLGTKQAIFAAKMASVGLKYKDNYEIPGAAIHDACTVIYALYPEIFTTDYCNISIETKGKITRGKTVCDCYSDAQKTPNTTLVLGVNREAFVEKLTYLLSQY